MRNFVCAILSLLLFAGLSVAGDKKQPETGTDKGLNILFFGNSFTFGALGGNVQHKLNGVPGLVKELAKAAGKDVPNVQKSTSGGKTLEWHLKNKVQTIATPDQWQTIPEGFKWDYVVMQEYSTRPTTSKMNHSDPAHFKKDVITLYKKVAEHSPDVKVVLYETWARHPEFEKVYPDNFANPQEFQKQLRENYTAAAAGLQEAVGKPVVKVAPCGDAWEKLNFDKSLFGRDMYHGSMDGYLLNAMIIYRTIYGGKIGDIAISDELIKKIGTTPEQVKKLAQTADSMEIKTSFAADAPVEK